MVVQDDEIRRHALGIAARTYSDLSAAEITEAAETFARFLDPVVDAEVVEIPETPSGVRAWMEAYGPRVRGVVTMALQIDAGAVLAAVADYRGERWAIDQLLRLASEDGTSRDRVEIALRCAGVEYWWTATGCSVGTICVKLDERRERRADDLL